MTLKYLCKPNAPRRILKWGNTQLLKAVFRYKGEKDILHFLKVRYYTDDDVENNANA